MRVMCSLYVCLALAASVSPATAQAPSAAPVATPAVPFEKPAAPGQLMDIGDGRRLHVLCKGSSDGPAVIFEAGLSQYSASSTYGKAQDAIAAFARVCIYDRAGLGWSDPAPAGRTHQLMVDDLRRLLAAAKIPGP